MYHGASATTYQLEYDPRIPPPPLHVMPPLYVMTPLHATPPLDVTPSLNAAVSLDVTVPPRTPRTETLGSTTPPSDRERREDLLKNLRGFSHRNSLQDKSSTTSCSSSTPTNTKTARLSAIKSQASTSKRSPRASAPQSKLISQDVRSYKGHSYRDPSCGICYNAFSGTEYFHKHDSTQNQREFAKGQSNNAQFFCTICKGMEDLKRPTRRRILISSSTLAGFWEHSSFKTDLHMDCEVIVGGRVRDGCRAWRRSYMYNPEPCDIIVCMGVNNLGDSQPIPDIMQEIKDFASEVDRHSKIFSHEIPNTITFCTVIQPPKFVCFNLSNPYPHLADGRNKKFEFEQLNEEIRRFNQERGVWGPRMHIYGIRTHPLSGLHEHHDTYKDYDMEVPKWWKEKDLHKRLHFTMEKRAAIAMRIVKHFRKTL